MRTKILFAILIFLGGVISPASMFGEKKSKNTSMSLRQQIDSNYANLERNLKSDKSTRLKFNRLKRFILSTQDLRTKNPRQMVQDELYFDLLLNSLSDLPSVSEFKKEECPSYNSKIIKLYDPRAPMGKTKEPSLLKTLNVLNIICQSKE